MEPLPTPEEMSRWDQAAMELGIPGVVLMENASREAFHALQECVGSADGKRIVLFMGSGNNGGDAACLARHLLDAGASVLVLHTQSPGRYKGMARQHIQISTRCGVPFMPAEKWLREQSRGIPHVCDDWEVLNKKSSLEHFFSSGSDPDIVVDGLLGTGFSGVLRPQAEALVRAINRLARHAFVFALDIPSGLSGLSGKPQPIAVRADVTVTFEAAKPGLVLPEAAPYTGKLLVRPIGMPLIVRKQIPASYALIAPSLADALPMSRPGQHKGTSGAILIIGGSDSDGKDLTGATHLAAWSALRSGAGLVSVAAPEQICQRIKGVCPDIMGRPLGCGKEWSEELLCDLLPSVTGICQDGAPTRNVDAVVIGPGMGRSPGAAAFVRAYLALENRPPAVIDADALYALTPETRQHLRSSDVLTPHPGEAAHVLGISAAEVQTDRLAALTKLTQDNAGIWILKGAGTLVGKKGHPTALSPYDVPNLAVGGSGDILAGCLGALIAQRAGDTHAAEEPPADDPQGIWLAACLAVLVHAEAGRLLAADFPQRGNTATDIADALPKARALLLREVASK